MIDHEFALMAISTVGFPIAVTCYLLYERSHRIQDMHESMNEHNIALTKAVTELTTLIREKI